VKSRRDSGEQQGLVRLTVRAKPRAKKSRVLRVDGLAIDVALAAPPVDGAANDELLATIAAALGVAKRAVRLIHGETSKNKVVEVAGMAEPEVRSRLLEAQRAAP
jgi:uncharacterized protein (TIGR00251 family)